LTKANPIKLLVLVSAVIIWQSAAAQVLTPSAIGEAPVLAAINGRANVALSNSGATAFASSSLNSGYLPGRVNDGTNDNSGNAWIAATTNDGEYVGISFPAAITLAAVAFDGETGYWSRSESTWSVQYTRDASPGGGSSWTQIGVLRLECRRPNAAHLFRVHTDFERNRNSIGQHESHRQ